MVYYLLQTFDLNEWLSLLLGGCLFIVMYLFFVLIFRVLDRDDIQDLRLILSAMGPLTPIFNIFLTFFEKLMK